MILLKDDNSWIVISNGLSLEFTVIEDACVHLERNGIKDDDIDMALIEMSINNNNKAHFNTEGNFLYTDNTVGEG